jgi:putative nucleotidyltransferase with HDIG domain
MTFRVRITLLFAALLGAMTALSYVVTARAVRERLLDGFVTRAETFAEGVAAAAGYGLLSKDLLGLDSIVSKTKDVGLDVRYVAIADVATRIVVHSETMRNGSSLAPAGVAIVRQTVGRSVVYALQGDVGGLLEVRCPVRFMGRELGSVVVGIDRSSLSEAQDHAGWRLLGTFLAVFVLGIAAISALAAHVARPIGRLSRGVDALKRGGGARAPAVRPPDELSRLTVDFQEMSTVIREQRDAIGDHGRELDDAYVATVRVIAASIEARDPYTHGHSSRVARLSAELGRRLGLMEAELDDLRIACLFHDVGKIRTPDAILRKHGRLSTSEAREMMRHPHHGAEILSHATFLLKYVPSVLHHHERWDGAGYPDGAHGDRIPLSAAIISLADAYDAMTSDRPYRRAMSEREAKEELGRCSGSQFRPALVEAFIAATGRC